MFSPNFEYILDFNYKDRLFMIRQTCDASIYLKIPYDLLDTSYKMTMGELSIKMICSRIRWESEKRLRIVNQNDLDCIFEICTTDPEDLDIDARYLKLISASKIDNLQVDSGNFNSPHMLCHLENLDGPDVMTRLVRANRMYKTSLQHAINTGNTKFNLLEMINKIDYLQPWDSFESHFDIELSFTWLDWLIME